MELTPVNDHAESGSVGDSLESLARLRCVSLPALYAGRGRILTTPIDDIDRAIGNAQTLLDKPGVVAPEMFPQNSADENSACF